VVHSPSLTSRFLVTKVPTKPPPNVEEVRNQFDQTLIRQLEEVGASSSQLYARPVNDVSPLRKLFQTRPVWTRAALLNQFTAAQAREIHKFVSMLSLRVLIPFYSPLRVAPRFSCRLLVMSSETVHGGIPWSDLDTTQGRILKQDGQRVQL
jgi:hypothetical protein